MDIPVTRRGNWWPSGYSLQLSRMTPQCVMHRHRHEFTELVIITGGRGTHYTDDDRYAISTGDVFVIPESQSHGYDDCNDLCLVNVMFDVQQLPVPFSDLNSLSGYHALFRLEPHYRRQQQFQGRLHLGARDRRKAMQLVDQIDAELREGSTSGRFMATACFMQLICFLSRTYSSMRHPASQDLLRLGDVLSFLEQNYHRPMVLDELSTIAHMSGSTLLRAFRKVTGQSPIEYLIQLRVRRAMDLMREQSLSITDIAYRVGFSDSNYFSRQFRKRIGMTPRQYRKSIGGE